MSKEDVNNEKNKQNEENEENKESNNEQVEKKNDDIKENDEVINEDKEDELQNVNNKLLRLQADFLNFKKRVEKERFTTYSNAISDMIKELLPVIDNIDRAVKSENVLDPKLYDGIKLINNQFIDILSKKGLKEIDAIDKKFDPNKHYGVAFEENSDKEEDTIIEVLQKGYTVNEKVIRPSMVKISKK